VNNVNSEIDRLKSIINKQDRISKLKTDPKFVSWTAGLRTVFSRGKKVELDRRDLNIHTYRPFTKKWLYYERDIIERPRKWKDILAGDTKMILFPNNGSKRNFACLMVDSIADLNFFYGSAQGFTLHTKNNVSTLLDDNSSNVSLDALEKFGLSAEDLFYYIYAVMHSSEYRNNYENDLKKQFPRIPILKNKEEYVAIGRKLADLHLNYESISPSECVDIVYSSSNPSYKVDKMRHPKKDELSTIIFNNDIIIQNIPEKAYEYDVNGRAAIQWIMDQYQVFTDPRTGIIDDPNEYSDDGKYIFNLLLSIINLSVKTVDLINSLPPLKIVEE